MNHTIIITRRRGDEFSSNGEANSSNYGEKMQF